MFLSGKTLRSSEVSLSCHTWAFSRFLIWKTDYISSKIFLQIFLSFSIFPSSFFTLLFSHLFLLFLFLFFTSFGITFFGVYIRTSEYCFTFDICSICQTEADRSGKTSTTVTLHQVLSTALLEPDFSFSWLAPIPSLLGPDGPISTVAVTVVGTFGGTEFTWWINQDLKVNSWSGKPLHSFCNSSNIFRSIIQ